jgi:hypothetical protein
MVSLLWGLFALSALTSEGQFFTKISSSSCNSKKGLYKSGFCCRMGTNHMGTQVVLPDGRRIWRAKWTVNRMVGAGVKVEAALMAIFRFLEHLVAFISIVVSLEVTTSLRYDIIQAILGYKHGSKKYV